MECAISVKEPECLLGHGLIGGHMNTQELQHQDELEQQQMILEALKRLWWWDMSEDGDADAFLISEALDLNDEFKAMLTKGD